MNPESKSLNYFITLPQRGVRIFAPSETRLNMDLARRKLGEFIYWTSREKARLELIKKDSILKKRYPTAVDGRDFMDMVSYERRQELLALAKRLADFIVYSWREINPEKEIAILLYGSVAKGLVKNGNHPDPSNIDMAVIGDLSEEEREVLYDEMRVERKEIGEAILAGCGYVEAGPGGIIGGNAGVVIQTPDKLTKNEFDCALNYIRSCAISLYDPMNLWSFLEGEALDYYIAKKQVKQRKKKYRIQNLKKGELVELS